jgi:hypothetical protein
MTLFLLGTYAFFCVVIGAALGFNGESWWAAAAFVAAGLVAIQAGFFLGLVLRG